MRIHAQRRVSSCSKLGNKERLHWTLSVCHNLSWREVVKWPSRKSPTLHRLMKLKAAPPTFGFYDLLDVQKSPAFHLFSIQHSGHRVWAVVISDDDSYHCATAVDYRLYQYRALSEPLLSPIRGTELSSTCQPGFEIILAAR
jgi:hypothetical protein